MRLLAPTVYALLCWWFSTWAILYLNSLPRSTHRWTLLGASVLLGLGLLGVGASASDTRVSAAYLGFTAALAVWAWVEVSFLLGYITGPRRRACPPGAEGWARAGHALMAILYHELALLLLGALLVGLCWGQPNQVGVWTFASLWIMRLSAKLNVFLGVRNLNEQFLPEHLRYIGSYFRHRLDGNPLFAASVIAATLGAAAVWSAARDAQGTPFEAAAAALVAAMLSLAVLEHWFMVLPLPSERLWQWGLRSELPAREPPAAS